MYYQAKVDAIDSLNTILFSWEKEGIESEKKEEIQKIREVIEIIKKDLNS